MSQPTDATNPVIIARFGKAHGVQGWLRLQTFTEEPLSVIEWVDHGCYKLSQQPRKLNHQQGNN